MVRAPFPLFLIATFFAMTANAEGYSISSSGESEGYGTAGATGLAQQKASDKLSAQCRSPTKQVYGDRGATVTNVRFGDAICKNKGNGVTVCSVDAYAVCSY